MPVARRWKMGYVLATRVDGELVEAKINVKMDEFFRNPRITAEGNSTQLTLQLIIWPVQ